MLNANLQGVFDKNIIAKDISLFIENGRPYIKYVGTTTLSNGTEVQITFPKIRMDICSLERNSEPYHNGEIKVRVKQECYICHDKFADIKVLKRAIKKSDLEKEFGYKIDLRED